MTLRHNLRPMWIFYHVALMFYIWFDVLTQTASSIGLLTREFCFVVGQKQSQYSIYKQKRSLHWKTFKAFPKIHTLFRLVPSLATCSSLVCKELPSYVLLMLWSEFLKVIWSASLSWALLCWLCEVSCPWIHGRLNINRSAFVLSYLHLLHSVRSREYS